MTVKTIHEEERIESDAAFVVYYQFYQDKRRSLKLYRDLILLENGEWKIAPQFVYREDLTPARPVGKRNTPNTTLHTDAPKSAELVNDFETSLQRILVLLMFGRRRIDPEGFGFFRRSGVPTYESFWVACVGATQHGLAALDHSGTLGDKPRFKTTLPDECFERDAARWAPYS